MEAPATAWATNATAASSSNRGSQSTCTGDPGGRRGFRGLQKAMQACKNQADGPGRTSFEVTAKLRQNTKLECMEVSVEPVNLDKPKSPILGVLSLSRKIFAGFKSRCQILMS